MKCFFKISATCILGPLWLFGLVILGLFLGLWIVVISIPVAAGCLNYDMDDLDNMGQPLLSRYFGLLDLWRNL